MKLLATVVVLCAVATAVSGLLRYVDVDAESEYGAGTSGDPYKTYERAMEDCVGRGGIELVLLGNTTTKMPITLNDYHVFVEKCGGVTPYDADMSPLVVPMTYN